MQGGNAIGEHQVRAELLKTGAAVGTALFRIDQTAEANKVTCFEIADGRTDLGDPSNNLVSRNAWIDRGHHVVPLIALFALGQQTQSGGSDRSLFHRHLSKSPMWL
jgi:hypothetical protein